MPVAREAEKPHEEKGDRQEVVHGIGKRPRRVVRHGAGRRGKSGSGLCHPWDEDAVVVRRRSVASKNLTVQRETLGGERPLDPSHVVVGQARRR